MNKHIYSRLLEFIVRHEKKIQWKKVKSKRVVWGYFSHIFGEVKHHKRSYWIWSGYFTNNRVLYFHIFYKNYLKVISGTYKYWSDIFPSYFIFSAYLYCLCFGWQPWFQPSLIFFFNYSTHVYKALKNNGIIWKIGFNVWIFSTLK